VYFPLVCHFVHLQLLERGEWALVVLRLVGLCLVVLHLVGLRLVVLCLVGLCLVVLRLVGLRLVVLRLVGLCLVGLLLVGLLLVGRMVLLAVLHRCISLVRAFLPPVVVSIQMVRALSCWFLLHLVDLVDLGLLLKIAPRRRCLRDP
jgi:hypothetical protein